MSAIYCRYCEQLANKKLAAFKALFENVFVGNRLYFLNNILFKVYSKHYQFPISGRYVSFDVCSFGF